MKTLVIRWLKKIVVFYIWKNKILRIREDDYYTTKRVQFQGTKS